MGAAALIGPESVDESMPVLAVRVRFNQTCPGCIELDAGRIEHW